MEEEKNIAEETLKKIKEDNIRPYPKWCFACKNYSFWILFFISAFLSALSTSVLVHVVFEDELYAEADDIFQGTSPYFPYFWLASVVLFILFLYVAFTKTKNSYKFETWFVATALILLILILAALCWQIGLGIVVHQIFSP